MAIDPKLVKWDDEQPSAIDPKQVQWDAPTPATAPAEQNNFGMTNIKGTLRNVSNMLGGLLRGAGDLGATAVLPVAMVKQKARGDDFWSMKDNAERRDDMTSALQDLGVDTNSLNFRGGRLASNVMGTAGAGGLVAGGARAVLPAAVATRAAPVLSAIESGGMTAGTGGMATRMLGGGINGATSAALVNPEDAQTGGVVGAIFPTAAKIGGTAGTWVSDRLGGLAQTLMQSALKPSKKAQLSGDAARAVQTLLDNGVNVSRGGVEKLQNLVSDLNSQISDKITNSTATSDRQTVLNALDSVRCKFSNQVDPIPDLNAIKAVADRFNIHPSIQSDAIPVQLAQQLKQGTYKVLNGKYGQLGSAETEAQKGLARGLKEEIANALPEIAPLNAKESQLLNALKLTESRVMQQANNNPFGIAGLATTPTSFIRMMLDKNALLKSAAARGVNASGKNFGLLADQLEALQNPVLRAGLLNLETSP